MENAEKNQNQGKTTRCIKKVLTQIINFIGKAIDKGNKNYLRISKENNEVIKISLTISTLLLILAFWPVIILLVAGLFFGFSYSLVGADIKNDKVNTILAEASEIVDDIKDACTDDRNNTSKEDTINHSNDNSNNTSNDDINKSY